MRRGQRNTLTGVCVAAFVGMVILVVLAAYPQDAPTVDGRLYVNEYATDGNNTGYWMEGQYCDLHTKYVREEDPNKGLYICNDWWNPEENYDPTSVCDGMCQFDWTDTDPTPDLFWRIKVYGNKDGNGQAIEVWRRVNEVGSSWVLQDCNDWYHAVGYEISPEHPGEVHPIWELRIPEGKVGADTQIWVAAPKFLDANDCPEVGAQVDARELPSYTTLVPSLYGDGRPAPPPCQ